MPQITANEVDIEYEVFGEEEAPPLFLIMGFGAQMIHWRADFCQQLADRGLCVVRFDNRDVGKSSKLDELGQVDVAAVTQAAAAGQPFEVPYTLDAMADDTVALMQALGHESGHVCGASMGGMIAQTCAIRHPERVRSLTSIMSTTGNPEVPPARPEAMAAILTPPPADREGAIDHAVSVWRAIGSPGFEFDEDDVRATAALAIDRGVHPPGIARQYGAILAHGNRRPALEKVETPALVIHGKEDPLVPWEGGRDTCDAVPRASMMTIQGMGHDLPRPTWPQIHTAIGQLVSQVEGRIATAAANGVTDGR